jgi:hypothetical protein
VRSLARIVHSSEIDLLWWRLYWHAHWLGWWDYLSDLRGSAGASTSPSRAPYLKNAELTGTRPMAYLTRATPMLSFLLWMSKSDDSDQNLATEIIEVKVMTSPISSSLRENQTFDLPWWWHFLLPDLNSRCCTERTWLRVLPNSMQRFSYFPARKIHYRNKLWCGGELDDETQTDSL